MADPNATQNATREGAVLANGSRVAVIGGGPAGSTVAYSLLRMAARADLDVAVDIYEPRRFDHPAPTGCNMCGGLISETLVQPFAAEGLFLDDDNVIQRGVNSYVLHTDIGSVGIAAPNAETRTAQWLRVPPRTLFDHAFRPNQWRKETAP